MQLRVTSDASYLGDPLSRSRWAGHYQLGDFPNDKPNGPILVATSLINNICTSACEAEMSAAFHNSCNIEHMRITLENLGHVQQVVVMIMDNEAAVNVFNDFAHLKHTHALNMRFFFVKELVSMGSLDIKWASGASNLADAFTKLLPVKEYSARRHLYVQDDFVKSSTHSAEGVLV